MGLAMTFPVVWQKAHPLLGTRTIRGVDRTRKDPQRDMTPRLTCNLGQQLRTSLAGMAITNLPSDIIRWACNSKELTV